MAAGFDNIIKFPKEAVPDVGALAETEAVAARWLARTTSGSLTLGEHVEFEYWRAASPDHDRIYGELEAMWERMDLVQDNDIQPLNPLRRALGRMRRSDPDTRRTLWLGRIAAVVALAVMASQYLSTWRYDYHTAPGEIRRIDLADGSIVYMKGGAALNAHVSGTGARAIELARGEAFFEVKHDPSRPFTVRAGSGMVRDIGTGFSVARTMQSATVAVEHGAVAVDAGGLSDLLTPGEQVSFNYYSMSQKLPVAVGAISAWRRGLYFADRKPLGDVLHDLNEYHRGLIIVTSPTLAARRVNALVQLGHIDAWLNALDETKGVAVRRLGPLTLVSDRQS